MRGEREMSDTRKRIAISKQRKNVLLSLFPFTHSVRRRAGGEEGMVDGLLLLLLVATWLFVA